MWCWVPVCKYKIIMANQNSKIYHVSYISTSISIKVVSVKTHLKQAKRKKSKEQRNIFK